MTRHHFRSSIPLLMFLTFTVAHVQGQGTTTPSPSPSQSRLFSVSSAGLMTKLLKSESDFINSTYTIQRHVSNVEQGIMQLLIQKRLPPSNQSLQPCNSNGKGYVNSMRTFLELRSLSIPDTSCLTVFEGIHNPSPSSTTTIRQTEEGEEETTTVDMELSENDVYEAITTRAQSMYRNRQKIADLILGNWPSSDVNIDYLYNTKSKRCIINHVGGLRVNDKWYIFTTITNAPRRFSAPLWQRQWLTEYIHTINPTSLSNPLRFGLAERPPDNSPPNTTHEIVTDTTTSLGLSRGHGGPYAFNSMYPEEIPALISAMDKSDLSIQQADDALAPSSLAILLLPLSLNVIPLAILTNPMAVTASIALMYALMTDVVTVIPLAIKGIELIYIGKTKDRSVVLRMSAAVNGLLSESAAVELWGAQCQARNNALPTGIAFVCFAIAFMIIGIVLELVARIWMNRKRTVQLMIKEQHEKSNNKQAVEDPLLSYDTLLFEEE